MKAFSFNNGEKSNVNITDITSIFNSGQKNLEMIKANLGVSNPAQINKILQQQAAAKAMRNQQVASAQPRQQQGYYAQEVINPEFRNYLKFASQVVGYKAEPERDMFIRTTPQTQNN